VNVTNSDLDILRADAFFKRVKGIAGGHRIAWSSADVRKIHDHVKALPADIIHASPTAIARKQIDLAAIRRKLFVAGVAVTRDIQPTDFNFLYIISSPRTDLSNDDIDQAGIDCEDYKKNNPVILDSHDSSALPIAVSSSPWLSSAVTMAIAKFPQPGISAESDRVAAAIRGGLVRGASIGFVPLRWSFAKDPARPMGISFHNIKMIEFSTCSIPCNPDCLLIGAVSGGKSAGDIKTADLRREARALADKARSISASIPDPVLTREQRLAEARNFRHLAGRS
jgi:hypothetical protein